MNINSQSLVAMSDANQNFSKVTRIVDDNGMAVILKNNKPRYVLVTYEEYDEIEAIRLKRKEFIEKTADSLIDENLDALLELAK